MNKKLFKTGFIGVLPLFAAAAPAFADVSGNMSDGIQATAIVGVSTINWVNFGDSQLHVVSPQVVPEGPSVAPPAAPGGNAPPPSGNNQDK